MSMIKLFNHRHFSRCCWKYNNRALFISVFFTTFDGAGGGLLGAVSYLVIFTTKLRKPLAFRGDIEYTRGSWG